MKIIIDTNKIIKWLCNLIEYGFALLLGSVLLMAFLLLFKTLFNLLFFGDSIL